MEYTHPKPKKTKKTKTYFIEHHRTAATETLETQAAGLAVTLSALSSFVCKGHVCLSWLVLTLNCGMKVIRHGRERCQCESRLYSALIKAPAICRTSSSFNFYTQLREV